ncbi:MAG TPA: hypothetical protein PKV71_09625 [Calditrichia bacterium]|nr:hypothetical protein [Calditrichia bacterium]
MKRNTFSALFGRAALLAALCFSGILAQGGQSLISQDRQVVIAPLYQSWSGDDLALSQFSTAFYGYSPLSRNSSLSLQFYQGATQNGEDLTLQGQELADPSGISDLHLLGNYYLNDMETLLGVGMSLPVGNSTLEVPEFRTVVQMSNDLLGFDVPVFGQGFNFTASAGWVHAFSPAVVGGLGAGFDLKGAFDLIKDIESEYNPGNEFSLTGGLDFVLNPVSSISTDILLTFYGRDEFRGNEIYQSGKKIQISGEFRQYLGFDELAVGASFRSKAKGNLVLGDLEREEGKKSTPNQFELSGEYRRRFSPTLSMQFLLESRFFQEGVDFPGGMLYGLGLQPLFKLNERFSIPVRGAFRFATFSTPADGTTYAQGTANLSGWEIGAGMQIGL